MQGLLYEEASIFYFALVTLVMGGSAAFLTGRACAATWRPLPVLVFYLLLLGGGVRFIHFAIFGGTLLSLHYYLADMLILLAIGSCGFRLTRRQQMLRQYYWLYEKKGWFGWKPRPAPME